MNSHVNIRTLGLTFITLITLSASGLSAKEADNASLTDPNKILHSIHLGQDWLNNFQKTSGLYHYIFRPWGFTMTPEQKALEDEYMKSKVRAPGEKPEARPSEKTVAYPTDDNIVRQILSYWAQIKSTQFRQTPEILKNIEEFERGLEPLIVIEDSPHGKALFIRFRDMMKVNSTALYLAALLSKKELGLPLTEDQKNHIHYAVNGLKVFAAPDAGFYYYHNTDRINFITSYGSGEAQYALAMYLNHYPDDELHEWTKQRFSEYFEKHFANNFSYPETYIDKERVGYHTWALYYLKESDKYKPVDYERFVKPLIKFSFDFKNVNPECQSAPCIYSMAMWDSSSVEGISAAYALMKKYEDDNDFMKMVENYLHESTDYLISLQINSVDEYNEKTGQKYSNNPKHLIGGFCDWPSCVYLRNEVSMHVVSALIGYYNQFHK